MCHQSREGHPGLRFDGLGGSSVASAVIRSFLPEIRLKTVRSCTFLDRHPGEAPVAAQPSIKSWRLQAQISILGCKDPRTSLWSIMIIDHGVDAGRILCFYLMSCANGQTELLKAVRIQFGASNSTPTCTPTRSFELPSRPGSFCIAESGDYVLALEAMDAGVM